MNVSEKKLIKQLRELPPAAQQEAADFVDYLYKKYIEQEKKVPNRRRDPFLISPFRLEKVQDIEPEKQDKLQAFRHN